MEEIFDIVDENDVVKGTAKRSEVHGNPDLIHRVVHILVFNSDKRLFLQKRSMQKDVQPGKWDTSVGGHVDSGESYEKAAVREMKEELGIDGVLLSFSHKYIHSNEIESEYVSTYTTEYNGKIHIDKEEIDDGRFFSFEEIEEKRRSGIFTPNFLHEFDLIKKRSDF